MKRLSKKGFTLAEILVSVAIIGLVSTGIYYFYARGTAMFSGTTTKKDVLADVRQALLWFERDTKEALVSPAMPIIEFTLNKIVFRKYPKGETKFDADGKIITENITYELVESGDRITLKRTDPAGRTIILCQSFMSAGSNKKLVGITKTSSDGKVSSGFRGFDSGYDPFVVDSPSLDASQKEAHRVAHTIYDKTNTASIELTIVVKKENGRESIFRTRVFPRTFSFGK